MGHREGARVVKRIVRAAPDLGIGVLTLYAFSADNWKRPAREVTALMRLFRAYLVSETARCVQNGVRVSVIGRRDRLSPALLQSIEAAETATMGGDTLLLRVAIDYSARDSIIAAAASADGTESREEFGVQLMRVSNSLPVPDVDLLIRTGGESRISDFLLFEAAYAELCFLPMMWPEFRGSDLVRAVEQYRGIQRRFGLTGEQIVDGELALVSG
jgi:undecaprenyl diphosphate synthase